MSERFDFNNEVLLGRFFEQERRRNQVIMRTRYYLSDEEAADVYQDSCLALFNNIKEGRLSNLSSSLSTYFTQICVNQSLKHIRDSRRYVRPVDDIHDYDDSRVSELLDRGGELTEQEVSAMHSIVAKLPPPCESIIWACYRDNMRMDEIARLVGYRNAQTAKAKKSQCLSKLSKNYKQRLKNTFYGE